MATIFGTPLFFFWAQDDVLAGTRHDDTIYGLNGDDVIRGYGGRDKIFGGFDHDLLIGGGGADELYGEGGSDTLIGGAGGDYLDGSDQDGFDDMASYAGSPSSVIVFLGGPTSASLASGGHASGDTLFGIEDLEGSDHNDWLMGNADHNKLVGGRGNDGLHGGDGLDHLIGGIGNDTLDGGSDDYLIETPTWGRSPDPAYLPRGYGDTLEGGSGHDTVSYRQSDAGVRVDLRQSVQSGGHAEQDVLSGIESVIGSDHTDYINGNEDANRLQGKGGFDQLHGHAGNDTLDGGAGYDVLFGGSGFDHFVFQAGRGGTEDEAIDGMVVDFEPEIDTIVVQYSEHDTFEALMAASREQGGVYAGTVLDIGPEDQILLWNVSMDALEPGDFQFL